MGTQFSRIAVAIGVLACSACGGALGSIATSPLTTATSLATPPVDKPASPDVSPPFVDPSAPLDELARRFVTAALGYDAWTEDRRSFLTRLDGLATAGELARLHRSERAHLRWWVLRQRLEQVTIHVTGVSQQPQSDDQQVVRVEGIRTTRSSGSTVREFVDVALLIVRTPSGLRVDRAEGAGL